MKSNTTAIIDIDWCKYNAASIGQKNYIIATHRNTKNSYKCDNITEFWGHHSKKAGGLLATLNKGRDSPYLPEEWVVEKGYTLNPIENVLHSAKIMVESAIERSGASKYKSFIGEGASFREDISTLQKYKNRIADKPHYLGEVSEYLKKKFNSEVITGLEVDDVCVIECYGKEDHFIIGEDKDFYSCPIKYFNVNDDKGVVDCRGFGYLERKVNGKGKLGKVIGKGRLHLYHQIMYGDDVDTYHAAYASEKSYGTVKAYNTLVNCKDDKEAFTALVESYKYLYPEPKEFVGWRGDTLNIDWLYVMQEMFEMAHMHRWVGDKVKVSDILDKLGVKY